ncbi:MAG: MGH1-like glycoside hydrolase domain-containing protein, partial [Gammaproteobacteria bacterium]
MDSQRLQPAERDAAVAILRKNDRGGHTVPTDGLYPFQWSWDSAITALGWMRIDEERAWAEVETMFSGQWENGMVPHILFHGESGTYFPGPEVWGSGRELPSSAISQPAVWATTIRAMLERANNHSLATDKVVAILPKLIAYHDWWYRERDPDGTGFVCSYHPWESGMDNSPAWDEALMNVPPVDYHYERRDLHLVESEQRPTHEQYDRYLYLVDFYKGSGFDSDHIYAHCPYKVLDIGLIAILHRGTKDLLALCDQLSCADDTQSLHDAMKRTESAIDRLWRDDKSCFASHDLLTDTVLDEIT